MKTLIVLCISGIQQYQVREIITLISAAFKHRNVTPQNINEKIEKEITLGKKLYNGGLGTF